MLHHPSMHIKCWLSFILMLLVCISIIEPSSQRTDSARVLSGSQTSTRRVDSNRRVSSTRSQLSTPFRSAVASSSPRSERLARLDDAKEYAKFSTYATLIKPNLHRPKSAEYRNVRTNQRIVSTPEQANEQGKYRRTANTPDKVGTRDRNHLETRRLSGGSTDSDRARDIYRRSTYLSKSRYMSRRLNHDSASEITRRDLTDQEQSQGNVNSLHRSQQRISIYRQYNSARRGDSFVDGSRRITRYDRSSRRLSEHSRMTRQTGNSRGNYLTRQMVRSARSVNIAGLTGSTTRTNSPLLSTRRTEDQRISTTRSGDHRETVSSVDALKTSSRVSIDRRDSTMRGGIGQRSSRRDDNTRRLAALADRSTSRRVDVSRMETRRIGVVRELNMRLDRYRQRVERGDYLKEPNKRDSRIGRTDRNRNRRELRQRGTIDGATTQTRKSYRRTGDFSREATNIGKTRQLDERISIARNMAGRAEKSRLSSSPGSSEYRTNTRRTGNIRMRNTRTDISRSVTESARVQTYSGKRADHIRDLKRYVSGPRQSARREVHLEKSIGDSHKLDPTAQPSIKSSHEVSPMVNQDFNESCSQVPSVTDTSIEQRETCLNSMRKLSVWSQDKEQLDRQQSALNEFLIADMSIQRPTSTFVHKELFSPTDAIKVIMQSREHNEHTGGVITSAVFTAVVWFMATPHKTFFL